MASEDPPDALIDSLVLALGATQVPDIIKRCSRRSTREHLPCEVSFNPFARLSIRPLV
jgi:hypothetical protein